MMCPVCKRELAPTLSICFTCGAMVNDTVREELQAKIERISGPLERKPSPIISNKIPELDELTHEMPAAPAKPIETTQERSPKSARTETIEFRGKNTSPTLVGFQPKSNTVPDWRLQLQNSVRQRKSDAPPSSPTGVGSQPVIQRQLVTNGANAIKAQFVEDPAASDHANPRIANALKRIEDSRRRYLPGDRHGTAAVPAKEQPQRAYPFNVVARSNETTPAPSAPQATVNAPPKPRLVSSMRIEKKKYDTNKLPTLHVTNPEVESSPITAPDEHLSISLRVPAAEIAPTIEQAEIEFPMVEETGFADDIDDLAPHSSRFLAGLFDMIIGGFVTAIILSPLFVSGRPLFTIAGVLAIAATFGIVMFIYLTLAVGLRGRTLGMRLFSLEIVDAEENEYPTLHQAAVNSAVFLLTLPWLGIGFVPAFVNEERRAAHDLVSGTILVKEI